MLLLIPPFFPIRPFLGQSDPESGGIGGGSTVHPCIVLDVSLFQMFHKGLSNLNLQGSVILVVQMLTLLNYTKRTKHTSSTPSAPSISLPPLPASHKDCYCIPNHLQGHDCNLGHVQDDDCNMDSVGGCDGSSEHSNYAAFVEGSVHSVVDRTLYNLEGSSSTNMNSVGGVDGSSKLPTISNSVGGVTSLPDTSVLAHNDSSQTATDSTRDL